MASFPQRFFPDDASMPDVDTDTGTMVDPTQSTIPTNANTDVLYSRESALGQRVAKAGIAHWESVRTLKLLQALLETERKSVQDISRWGRVGQRGVYPPSTHAKEYERLMTDIQSVAYKNMRSLPRFLQARVKGAELQSGTYEEEASHILQMLDRLGVSTFAASVEDENDEKSSEVCVERFLKTASREDLKGLYTAMAKLRKASAEHGENLRQGRALQDCGALLHRPEEAASSTQADQDELEKVRKLQVGNAIEILLDHASHHTSGAERRSINSEVASGDEIQVTDRIWDSRLPIRLESLSGSIRDVLVQSVRTLSNPNDRPHRDLKSPVVGHRVWEDYVSSIGSANEAASSALTALDKAYGRVRDEQYRLTDESEYSMASAWKTSSIAALGEAMPAITELDTTLSALPLVDRWSRGL